jgi:hypothetical protein
MPYRKVSVLVPTRNRLGSLARMLRSFDETVGASDEAEVILRCDGDDIDSIAFLRGRPHRFIVGPREEGYRSLPRFFNEMARLATGDLLMCGNDDVEFRTPGWPRMLLDAANRYPDGIFNLGVRVGLNDDKFPFSVVSRKLVDALGFINDERLLFSDVFLLDVAAAFDRAIRLESVTVFHDWAGHDCDETRRDANRHEFALAFKDATGAWSDEYLAKHRAAVAEAVHRIRRSGLVSAVSVIEAFEVRVPDAVWSTNGQGSAIHYARTEVAQIIDVILRHEVNAGQAVVSTIGNGLPTLLWLQLFADVVTLEPREGPLAVSASGAHTVISGAAGSPRFLHEVVRHLRHLRAVIIDEPYYATASAVYHLIGGRLERPGIIVFLPMAEGRAGVAGVRRFVDDLRSGAVDNRRHLIADVSPEIGGPGMSYELFL